MKIVIVGAGPAGITAAETVRPYDPHAEIVVLSAEPYPPYSPPAMIDHFLTGSNAHFWRGEDWSDRFRIDYRSSTQVAAVVPAHHRLRLTDGTTLGYDQLVIASGSRLYAPVKGSDLPGIHNFKSLSTANALIKQVRDQQARTAVIVGAGFIGMEIALLLCALGVRVTQVEMLDQVMPRMLDAETAGIVLNQMRARGVDVRLNTRASAFVGSGYAQAVELEGGGALQADILIAATGVKPNTELLEDSGIEFQWGITVDDHLRTSVPNIFAAGDVVETADRLTGESYVHAIFPNAVEQGRVVGLNLLGYDEVYEGADSMNSLKHLGIPVMAVGHKAGGEVLRYQRADVLRTIYLADNRIVGFQLVSDISAAGVLRELMNRHVDIRPFKDRLARPDFGQGAVVWQAITDGIHL
jgi:nitrite reductase (NADH) large subunit